MESPFNLAERRKQYAASKQRVRKSVRMKKMINRRQFHFSIAGLWGLFSVAELSTVGPSRLIV